VKKFMVIGLGNFGFQVARSLFEDGSEVIAIDSNRDRVQDIRDFCTRGIVADAENKDFLQSVGAQEMDGVILSMGDNISQSIITTLLLKELNVKYLIAKANDPEHGKALRKVGADRVIFPEQEVAIKLAQRLTSPSILDSLELGGEYVLTELLPPMEFVGQSLMEVNLRRVYNLFVVAIKEAVPERVTVLPPAEYVIKDSDTLVILGSTSDIARLNKKTKVS
jgi:trk system potassium uptake protein